MKTKFIAKLFSSSKNLRESKQVNFNIIFQDVNLIKIQSDNGKSFISLPALKRKFLATIYLQAAPKRQL